MWAAALAATTVSIVSIGLIVAGNGDGSSQASAQALEPTTVAIDTAPDGNGYVVVSSIGAVDAYGTLSSEGDASRLDLRQAIVDVAVTPTGEGYWLVAADGGVFSYGDAAFHGSTGAIALDEPIVAMHATPSGRGYWLVATDGGVFAFGDAGFFGSTGGLSLRRPVVGIDVPAGGRGYWLVASDGGVFAFGDAGFFGSTGGVDLDEPVMDLVRTDSGRGYRMLAVDGGEFAFGDARLISSLAGRGVTFSAAAVRPQDDGHWFVTSGGQLQQSGLAPRLGAPVPGPPSAPIPDLGSSSLELVEIGRFDEPIAVRIRPGDGTHLWIAERAGRIVRWNPATNDRTTFVDVSALSTTSSERGLLGFDFSPDGRHIYLNHTDSRGNVELAEYDLAGIDAGTSAATRRFLLEITQPFGNHNGGDIHVTADGLVWASSGDGGSGGDPGNNAQNRSNLLGTIYRIDPSPSGSDAYTVPSDNPFVGVPGVRPEIWAYGLRNPWRFDIDEVGGQIWIADVGQNAVEEINLRAIDEPGANFGWKRFEGDDFFADVSAPGAVGPVHTYRHGPGCSVTGGVLYDGPIASLTGAYLYADLCSSVVSAVRVGDGGLVESADIGVRGSTVVAFGVDHDGHALIVELGGSIRRLVETG